MISVVESGAGIQNEMGRHVSLVNALGISQYGSGGGHILL